MLAGGGECLELRAQGRHVGPRTEYASRHLSLLSEPIDPDSRRAATIPPRLYSVRAPDGVDDNWTFLSDELPAVEEILDFFHATEHLNLALAAAYGAVDTRSPPPL